MKKLSKLFNLLAAVAWLVALCLAVFNPYRNYRIPFIAATFVLILLHALLFISGGEENDRQIEEPEDESGWDGDSDGNDPC